MDSVAPSIETGKEDDLFSGEPEETGERMVVRCKGQDIEFVSSHTDEEVVRLLAPMIQKSMFHSDLYRIAGRKGWSPLQRAWAHYFIFEAEHPKPVVTVGGLEGLVGFFDTAFNAKLRWPTITLRHGGKVCRMRRVESGANAGCINVTDDGHYPSNIFYGRIKPNGTTTISDEAALSLLRELATDVPGKAAELGRNSGCCCFCNTPLTTDISVTNGYGPVCAKKWGLPWKKA